MEVPKSIFRYNELYGPVATFSGFIVFTTILRLMASPRHGGAGRFIRIFQSLIRRGGVPPGAAGFIVKEDKAVQISPLQTPVHRSYREKSMDPGIFVRCNFPVGLKVFFVYLRIDCKDFL
jgi:hypothetical protein